MPKNHTNSYMIQFLVQFDLLFFRFSDKLV